MWVCGEVSVNYRSLSDSRVDSGDFLDQLLTSIVTAIIHGNMISCDAFAQDAMRVRAPADKSSFRRAISALARSPAIA